MGRKERIKRFLHKAIPYLFVLDLGVLAQHCISIYHVSFITVEGQYFREFDGIKAWGYIWGGRVGIMIELIFFVLLGIITAVIAIKKANEKSSEDIINELDKKIVEIKNRVNEIPTKEDLIGILKNNGTIIQPKETTKKDN